MGLQHLCVDVETGVTKLSDFFGQQFNTVDGVAEDDGLVNLELQEQEHLNSKQAPGVTLLKVLKGMYSLARVSRNYATLLIV